MILCIALVSLIAMPVTAEEGKESKETTEAARTMEEILNDFHARSAALTTAGANSRAASTDQKDQLKQETIAELNAAGYSAYDVNPTSYNDLEETLQTDFSQMGLDPNGSYIIVISGEEGEEEEEKPANGTRDLILPPHQWEDDTPAGGSFFYTYYGKQYEMRYITVTTTENSHLRQTNDVELLTGNSGSQAGNALDVYLTVISYNPALSTTVSILSLILSVLPIAEDTVPDSLDYRAGSIWTPTYIQVYDADDEEWKLSAGVEHVTLQYLLTYTYYVGTSTKYYFATKEGTLPTMYSTYYNNREYMKEIAAYAFESGAFLMDAVEQAVYKFDGRVVLTHTRWDEPAGYEPA